MIDARRVVLLVAGLGALVAATFAFTRRAQAAGYELDGVGPWDPWPTVTEIGVTPELGGSAGWYEPPLPAYDYSHDGAASAFHNYQEIVGMPPEKESQNLGAFLMMVRHAEGTAGPNGYRTMFGGELFDSFADHPRQKITATFKGGLTVTSTAAGAYQFLSTTWDDARRATGVPDFSPASQDRAAIWLLKRRGALEDVKAGRFDVAVAKCAKEWASLPGSPYGQPTISATRARDLYVNSGGVFA